MWRFRSKQSSRDLLILKTLFIDEKKITIQQLSKLLDCDIKTARARILEINIHYDALPNIIYDYETDSVFAEYDPSFWPFMICREFYSNNLEFQILEYLFIHENPTTYEILDFFSISHSTLKRVISNLNLNLKHLDIYIDSKGYRILGDELSITKFFTQYFVEKTQTDYCHRFKNLQQALFNIYRDILETVDQPELKFYFNRFQWSSFVSIVRYSQGYTIPNKIDIDPEKISGRVSMISKKDVHCIEGLFGISFYDEETVNDIFYLYFHPINNPRYNKYSYSEESVYCLLEDVMQTFSIDYEEKDQEKLYNLLFGYLNQFFSPGFLLFNRPQYEVKQLEKMYPLSIQTFRKIFSSYFMRETGEVEDSIYHQTILFVINTFPKMKQTMSNYEKKIKVNCLFVSSFEISQEVFMFLNNNFSFMAEFNLVETNSIPQDEDIKKGVWITDVKSLSAKNCLVISPNLMSFQGQLIYDYIENHRNKIITGKNKI